jgi:hypothetical protein
MHRFYNRPVRSDVSEMNSCPKVSLLTISIILATRLSSNLSKISSNSKMGFTPLCFLEIQIEPVLKQSEKISVVPENQIFNVTVNFK